MGDGIGEGFQLVVRQFQRRGAASHAQFEILVELAEFLFRALVLLADAQNRDAEGQIAGQLLQKRDLIRRERSQLGGINAESAKGVGVFILERQGDGCAITAQQQFFQPNGGAGIGYHVQNAAGFSTANSGAGWAASVLRIRPSNFRIGKKAVVDTHPDHGAHRLGLIVFRVPYPSHAVAGLFANSAADVDEQPPLVLRPYERLIAVADGQQFAVQPAQNLRLDPVLSGAELFGFHQRLPEHLDPNRPCCRSRRRVRGRG